MPRIDSCHVEQLGEVLADRHRDAVGLLARWSSPPTRSARVRVRCLRSISSGSTSERIDSNGLKSRKKVVSFVVSASITCVVQRRGASSRRRTSTSAATDPTPHLAGHRVQPGQRRGTPCRARARSRRARASAGSGRRSRRPAASRRAGSRGGLHRERPDRGRRRRAGGSRLAGPPRGTAASASPARATKPGHAPHDARGLVLDEDARAGGGQVLGAAEAVGAHPGHDDAERVRAVALGRRCGTAGRPTGRQEFSVRAVVDVQRPRGRARRSPGAGRRARS